MLTAEQFRKKNRKTVTLSSGEEILIRKIKLIDCALRAGTIPSSFWEEGDQEKAEVRWDSIPQEERDFYKNLGKVIVTSGVLMPKIVDKDVTECSDDEISYEELPDDMSTEILLEIKKFNGMSKEAGTEVARFPEESEASGNA